MTKLANASQRGGSKPGERRGGRQKGTRNKRSVETEARVAEAAQAVAEALPDAFQGDAHALLMLVYKNEANDIAVRMDAAKAAIAYEKPRLASNKTEHSGAFDLRAWLIQPDDD